MSITENLNRIKSTLPVGVTLVAVSKTKPNEAVLEAYRAGQRVFGENKVQEMVSKYEALPKDIEWHLIGHLQTNKVKYIAPFVSMIHSVDSLKLLSVIDKEGERNGRIIQCLLQFHIADEETKFGLSYDEAVGLLESEEYRSMKNIRIRGVMGMATFSDDVDQVRSEFANLKNCFDRLKSSFFMEEQSFSEISMGMSDDYLLAIGQGSTMVRVGSSIFGVRNYSVEG
ncbi:MAG TPA: YggS family pyridoxal phosphate-dependent enzyme [Prolixibacteraceae bacterium]|nr:YggS family pyridoxal phosphate-dependent enzyme [Prolixibacteraceae bacterium]